MNKFQIGDKVVSIKNTPEILEGFVGYVIKNPLDEIVESWAYAVRKENYASQVEYFHEDELELLSVSLPLDKTIYDTPPVNNTALDVQVGGDHYKSCKIQPIEYIQANALTYLEGNVIKYTTRHSKKNGKADILKAIHYLELILEFQYKEQV